MNKKVESEIMVSPGFIFPAGKLGKMSEPGFGGLISYSRTDIFSSRFFIGIQSGFYYLNGKETSDRAQVVTDRVFIAPVMSNFGYSIPISRHFYINPSVSFGASYFNIEYSPKNEKLIAEKKDSRTFWDPDIKSGISMFYRFDRSYIGVSADYGIYIEKDDITRYGLCNLILGYRY